MALDLKHLAEKFVDDNCQLVRILIFAKLRPSFFTMVVNNVQNIVVFTALFLEPVRNGNDIALNSVKWLFLIHDDGLRPSNIFSDLLPLKLADLTLDHVVFKINFGVREPISGVQTVLTCSPPIMESPVYRFKNLFVKNFVRDLPPVMLTYPSKVPKLISWVIWWHGLPILRIVKIIGPIQTKFIVKALRVIYMNYFEERSLAGILFLPFANHGLGSQSFRVTSLFNRDVIHLNFHQKLEDKIKLI